MAKVATTTQLAKIIRDSSKHEYNRSYADPQEIISKLDPNGFHILSVLMPHEHIDGVRADLHYRTQVYMKIKGYEAPHEAMIDVSPGLFDALEDAPGMRGRKLGAGKTETHGDPNPAA
jgi:hypothetical protein